MSTFISKDDPLLVVIGPSGVGKSTVMEKVVQKSLIEISPTWTDRPVRQGENSIEHVFVSPEDMDRKASEGFFLNKPMAFFNLPYRYAIARVKKPDDGKIPCIMARVSVIPLLTKFHDNFVIYQIEALKEIASSSIKSREKSGSDQGSRLDDYDKEIQGGREVSNRIFTNKSIDSTAKAINDAIVVDFNL